MNKPPDFSPRACPSFLPSFLDCTVKLPWQFTLPSLARRGLAYFCLNSFCFTGSEAISAWSTLACSTWERCPIFVKSQWLFRLVSVPPLMPSSTSVADLFAQLGSVGVTLGPSFVVLQVADSPNCRFAVSMVDGCLVALLIPLHKGSLCVMVHILPDWSLPIVSTHCRLLDFRSEFQVCFLPLYPPPLRVICCLSFYLMTRTLKSSLNPLGSRLIPSNGFFLVCWMLLKQVQFLDIIYWVLGHLGDVTTDVLRMATLIALNPINGCSDLNLNMDVFASYRGFWKGLFGFHNRCLNAYPPCFGNVFISVHLATLARVSSFSPLWHFVLLMLSCSCLLRSLVTGLVGNHVFHLPKTRLGSRGLVFCKDHQGSLLRLHLYLADDSPRRTMTINYLMLLVNELSEPRVAILLNWVPPSVLFSQRSLAGVHLPCFKPSLPSMLHSSLALPLIWC